MSPWTLNVAKGDAAGTQISSHDELLIGRTATGEGQLGGDPELSRRHARISRASGGDLVIEDLQSTNGTFVNGTRIAAAQTLRRGDVVRVGRTTLEVVDDGRDGASEPTGRVAAAAPPPAPAPPPAALGGPPADIIHSGRRHPIPAQGLTIGRREENDIVLQSEMASRDHARIDTREGRHFVADLGAVNGTYLNGERLRNESRYLNTGDTVAIGGEQLRYLTGQETRVGGPVAPVLDAQIVRFDGERLTIGRDPENDLVLPDPNVSRFHAEVVAGPSGVELRDLSSRNGTRVNGQPVGRALLETGSEIGVGTFRLVFDGTDFLRRDDRGALRLHAEALTIAIKGKTILNRASLDIQPGELVAFIGESGSGKTTMLKALAGVTQPTEGAVLVSGEPVEGRLSDIGYVPQSEIVHANLTVREALTYAAKLRLPPDSSEADIDTAVGRVLDEIALTEHGDTRVGSLSGGQRKRAGVAVELLNRPSLLFLDEPTTGMDPGLETRMMELFRQLAEPGKRAVTLVTHATKNLGLVDKVVVMGRGGELTFFGTPDEAKRFFAVDTFDGIYSQLDETPATEWRARYESSAGIEREQAPPVPPPRPKLRRSVVRQARVLASRYAKLLLRDKRNMAIVLGQAPAIALAVSLLFKTNVLNPSGNYPAHGSPRQSVQMLFLLLTTAIWLGSIDSSREIIKEKALVVREAAVGVRWSAYIASKLIVLLPLVAIQALVLAGIVITLIPLHESGAAPILMLALVVLTGFVAIAQGLFVSAFVRSEDQATSMIPLVLLPQLLFAGAIVTLKDMGPVKALTYVIFSRWSFAGSGSIVHMNKRIADDPLLGLAGQNPFPDTFFSIKVVVVYVILAVFFAVMIAALSASLRRFRD